MAQESPEDFAKVALLTHLRSGGDLRSCSIISELAVEKWARRADVVTVGTELTCYEVKSSADRLSRLDAQIDAYSRVFDRVYAVVATKHMNAVMSRVPTYLGLKELVQTSRGLEARHVREALPSPALSMDATLSMLPVSELAKIVRLLSGTPVTERNRAALLEAAASLPMAAIRKHVVQYLRERYSASSAVFNGEVLGRRITSADLRHLSIWQAAPAQSSDRVDPAAEWLALLSREGAFGPVPEDVRNLLATS